MTLKGQTQGHQNFETLLVVVVVVVEVNFLENFKSRNKLILLITLSLQCLQHE